MSLPPNNKMHNKLRNTNRQMHPSSEDGARVNPLSPKSRKFLTEENIGGGKTGGDISTIDIKGTPPGNARKKTFFFQEVFPNHKKGSLGSGNVLFMQHYHQQWTW